TRPIGSPKTSSAPSVWPPARPAASADFLSPTSAGCHSRRHARTNWGRLPVGADHPGREEGASTSWWPWPRGAITYAHDVAASPPSRPRSRGGNNVSGLRCRRTVSGGGHVRPGGGILGRRVTGSDGRVPTCPAARANAGAVSAQPVAGPVVLLPARRR